MSEEPSAKKLLFVCPDNAARSQIAEALARMYGGTAVEAFSAGVRPAAALDPRAVEFMGDCGYDLAAHFPKGLGDVPAEVFDAAITIDCGPPRPPVRAGRCEHWEIPLPDPGSPEDFRAMGVLLEKRIRDLLGGL